MSRYYRLTSAGGTPGSAAVHGVAVQEPVGFGTMYRIVWEYDAEPARLKEFEKVYGPTGKWVEFFRRSPDYLGTEFFRSTTAPQRFITLDMWRTRSAYEAFRKEYAEGYAELDDWCRQLRAHERMVGMVDDGKN